MSYRLGLIGAGTIALVHAEAAAEVGVSIAGFCDVVKKKAESAASEYPGAIATTSVEELLNLPDVSAIVVATPNRLHKDHAVAVLESGRDVLLEKPMAMNCAQCDEIIRARDRTDQIVMVNFVSRCAPTVLAIERFIKSGRLGRIYHARATWIRRRGIPGLGGWFTTKTEAGGGVLIDLGVHLIDLVMHLTGRVRAMRASGACASSFGEPIERYVYTEMFAGPPNPKGVFDVEDAASALIRCEGGLTIDLVTTWAANVPEDAMSNGIALLGEKGGCFFDIWGDRAIICTDQDGQNVDITPHLPPGDRWMQAWFAQHKLFAESVVKRTPPPATAEDGREVQVIIEALYQSSEEGREVEIV